jgi:hypothetical protein
VQLLIERVDHDGQEGTVEILLRRSGIKAFSEGLIAEEHAA